MVKQYESENLNNQSQAGDEIDLLALLRSVVRTWRVALTALVAVTLVFGAYKAIKIAFLPSEVIYSKPIRLTFKGADKLQFPNEAKFSYGDIIAPAIASIVHERNHLNDYGVSVEDLQQSLTAEPYAPTYPLIILKYQKKMADKKLTVEQLSELEANMWSDVKQATSGTVLISMQFEKISLPRDVASKVLADIPAIWAEKTIRDKGVLDINIPISTAKTLNKDLIENVEYMIVSDLLDEKLSLLRKNIKVLSESQGVSTVKDPVTGMNLFDLSTTIDDTGKYVIDDVLSPIRYLGLTKENKSSIFYYEDKLKKSNMELDLLMNQADLAKQAYDSYMQGQQQSSQELVQKSGSSTLVSPQINNDLLDRLVAMSGDADREKYRQKLNQQWLEYTLEAAEIKNRISDTKQILAALRKTEANGGAARNPAEQEYLDRVKAALPEILAKLSSYFDITDRIYKQLSIESVGLRDQLYTPITNSVLVDKAGLEVKQTILTWIALMFLTVVIVVPTVMVRRALKEKAEA